MNKSTLLKNISLVLFGIVVMLLLSNILISKYITKDEQPKNRAPLNGYEIDNAFHSALKNYGFSDSWVSTKKIKNINGDSLFASYFVKVPKDLPIHLLLLELKQIFWENDVILSAEEITSGKKTLLKISSGNDLKLAVDFSYDEKVFRHFGTVSFLVSNLPLQDDLLKDT